MVPSVEDVVCLCPTTFPQSVLLQKNQQVLNPNILHLKVCVPEDEWEE